MQTSPWRATKKQVPQRGACFLHDLLGLEDPKSDCPVDSCSVSKKAVVGATLGRPQILQSKICRRKAKKGYFPSENPKNKVFRRATKGRPYKRMLRYYERSRLWLIFLTIFSGVEI